MTEIGTGALLKEIGEIKGDVKSILAYFRAIDERVTKLEAEAEESKKFRARNSGVVWAAGLIFAAIGLMAAVGQWVTAHEQTHIQRQQLEQQAGQTQGAR